MKAALLCPGPSLLRTYQGGEYGVRVAVNRSAFMVPGCDVWTSLDVSAFKHLPKVLLVDDATASWLAAERLFGASVTVRSNGDAIATADQPTSTGPTPWHSYSATSALVHLARYRPAQIDVYGADWSDEPDGDGVRCGEQYDRSAGRWVQERQAWEDVVRWLAQRGCTVKRVTE